MPGPLGVELGTGVARGGERIFYARKKVIIFH